ncbi:hypothetical protein PVAP13_4NG173500 [Panicum virgatum]|uniref:Uncharacterized protein n=1 Tax=Panicum virgatum TaxID=38727 RepID=A0A8T0TD18_PANVG|nr:hypothetical protein PVAP13_4NG173500 [Panicum virgatum]KAG2606417.1 hypothetical protein PVAP13_4NG173500 [Panicum virgatum]
MELSLPPPLVLGSHRQQERSFPAAALMAAGPPSPLVLPSDQAAPSPSPRRHKENSESLDPTPFPSHGDPWPDHNLQDIRNKLFPIKKRKVDSVKTPTTLPPKRKQRKAFLEAVA